MLSAAQPRDDEHERRVHLRIRKIFSAALDLVEPYFKRENAWTGVSLEHFAHRVLRENYPELDATEIYVFVAAARRFYASSERRRPATS
jgi:hypothetical protein